MGRGGAWPVSAAGEGEGGLTRRVPPWAFSHVGMGVAFQVLARSDHGLARDWCLLCPGVASFSPVVVLLGLMSLRALRTNRTGTPTVYPAGAWNPGRGGWQGPWVLRRRRLATDLQAIIAQALVTFL